MTIGVGMLARDGVVIAADSQVTADTKWQQGKISAMWKTDLSEGPDGTAIMQHPGGFVVALAGQPVGHAVRAAELAKNCFAENVALSADDLRVAIEAELHPFYTTHVLPYLHAPYEERPHVDLLIAVSRGGSNSLWQASNSSLLIDATPYAWIGSGQTQAHPLLSRLFRVSKMDLAESAMLAAFVVHQVKDVNVYCGKLTDLVCVRRNNLLVIPRALTKEIDSVYSEYEDVLLGSVLWDALDAHDQQSRSELTKAKRALRKLLARIRTECFGDRLSE